MAANTGLSKIIRNYLDKFPNISTTALVRLMQKDSKNAYDSENLRSNIRYVRGASGSKDRRKNTNKEYFKNILYYYIGVLFYYGLGYLLILCIYFYSLKYIDDLNWNNKKINNANNKNNNFIINTNNYIEDNEKQQRSSFACRIPKYHQANSSDGLHSRC